MDYPFISLGPAIHAIALALLFVFFLAAIGVAVALAALPGRIASSRNHPQSAAVNVCGWLGLPTGILWVVALVWAYWKYPSIDVDELEAVLNNLESTVTRLENQRKASPS